MSSKNLLSCRTVFGSIFHCCTLSVLCLSLLLLLPTTSLSFCPPLPSIFLLISLFSLYPFLPSDGPVVGQCDWDVGGPHGQHHPAWEEETVIPGPAFPPAIWQQVSNTLFLFLLLFFFLFCLDGTLGHKMRIDSTAIRYLAKNRRAKPSI